MGSDRRRESAKGVHHAAREAIDGLRATVTGLIVGVAAAEGVGKARAGAHVRGGASAAG